MSYAVEMEPQNILPAPRGGTTSQSPRATRAGSPVPMNDRRNSAQDKRVVHLASTAPSRPHQGHARQRTQTVDQLPRKGSNYRGLSTDDIPLMTLPTVPNTFDEASEYWYEYDKAADKHDLDMVSGLNDNVDVLLVFAGLFSGVNTAFIILSLALLSPGSSDETNALLRTLIQRFDNATVDAADVGSPSFVPPKSAIRVNCFFAASLSCSLLAAFGAMLGKQWIGHYKRTGQLGPLHGQGRQRQMKFNAVEKYHFRSVVEALPTLLQIALLLFFLGLINFLWLLDNVVATVVLAFAVLGLVAYGFTTVVASRDPHCPFQTPVSTFASRASPSMRDWLKKVKWDLTGLKKSLASLWSRGVSYAQGPLHTDDESNTAADYREVDKASVCWILENSARAEAQLAAAQSIPALSHPQLGNAVPNHAAFRQLVSLFKGSLNQLTTSLNRGSTSVPVGDDKVRAVVLYGRAICHLLIERSPSSEISKRKALQEELIGVDSKHALLRMHLNKGLFRHCYELVVLCECLVDPKSHSPEVYYIDPSALPLYLVSFPVMMEGQDRWGILKLAHYALSDSPTERIVGLVAWSLSAIKAEGNLDDDNEHLWERRWDAYTGPPDMFKHLLYALETYELHARIAVDRVRILNPQHNEAYADLIRAVVELFYDRHLPQYRELMKISGEILASIEQLLETLFLQVQAVLDQIQPESTTQLGTIGVRTLGDHEREETLAALRCLQGWALALVNRIVGVPHPQIELSLDLRPLWQTATIAAGDRGVLSQILIAMVHTEVPKKVYLNFFREYPSASSAIVDGLCHSSDDVWRAAIDLVSRKGKTWVDHDDFEIHRQFLEAGLARGLAAHLDEPGKVNSTVSVLLRRPEWRARFADGGFVDATYDAMMKIHQNTDLEPATMINGFFHTLQLWSFCSNPSYPEFQEPLARWMSSEMVSVVKDFIGICIQHPSRDTLTSTPVCPYVEASQKSATAEPDAVQGLVDALEDMKAAWERLRL